MLINKDLSNSFILHETWFYEQILPTILLEAPTARAFQIFASKAQNQTNLPVFFASGRNNILQDSQNILGKGFNTIYVGDRTNKRKLILAETLQQFL